MNKYKHIPTIITIVLLVAVMTVSVVAWAAWGTSDTEAATALDSQPLQEDEQDIPESEVFSLNQYALDVDDATKISHNSFSVMFSCTDEIVSAHDTICVENTPEIDLYLREEPLLDYVAVTDDTITIDIAACKAESDNVYYNQARYLVLLSLATSEYGEISRFAGPWLNPCKNYQPQPSIQICPDYNAAGYDSPQAYWEAFDNHDIPEDYKPYEIWLSSETIRKFGSQYDTDIWDEYLDNSKTSVEAAV